MPMINGSGYYRAHSESPQPPYAGRTKTRAGGLQPQGAEPDQDDAFDPNVRDGAPPPVNLTGAPSGTNPPSASQASAAAPRAHTPVKGMSDGLATYLHSLKDDALSVAVATAFERRAAGQKFTRRGSTISAEKFNHCIHVALIAKKEFNYTKPIDTARLSQVAGSQLLSLSAVRTNATLGNGIILAGMAHARDKPENRHVDFSTVKDFLDTPMTWT